jgi:hypothetical protein
MIISLHFKERGLLTWMCLNGLTGENPRGVYNPFVNRFLAPFWRLEAGRKRAAVVPRRQRIWRRQHI